MPLNFVPSAGLSATQTENLIKYNKELGLTGPSIRMIQHVLGAPVSGVFDSTTIDALVFAFGSGGSHDTGGINSQLQAVKDLRARLKRVQSGMGPPESGDAMLSSRIDQEEERLASMQGQLSGGLSRKIIWKVISELRQGEWNSPALYLAADFMVNGIDPEKVYFRYDKMQSAAYISRVELTDSKFGQADENFRQPGTFILKSAPSSVLIVSIGPAAFTDVDTLCKTLKKALDANVIKISTLKH